MPGRDWIEETMRTPRLPELEGRLLQPPQPGSFTSAELEGLPEPARAAISPKRSPRARHWRPARGCGCAAS
jgi:hypothetical protein